MQQKYELITRLIYFWYENIPKFYFCIRAPTFSTHMPCPLKIYSTNKVNAICGGVSCSSQDPRGPLPGSRVLGSHVPGSQVPRPRFPVPESQGSKSQGPRASGLRVPDPGSQVLILDYNRNFTRAKFLGGENLTSSSTKTA